MSRRRLLLERSKHRRHAAPPLGSTGRRDRTLFRWSVGYGRALGTILAAAFLGLAALPPAAAQTATATDRGIIDACVVKAVPGGTAEGGQAKPDSAASDPASCIGRVSKPCMDAPGGDTTMAMNGCISRELAVWDGRLNKHYAEALKALAQTPATRLGSGGKVVATTGAALVRSAQRAWLAFRDAKCSAAQLPMEGGSGASLLGGDCLLQETARQDLWLSGFLQP